MGLRPVDSCKQNATDGGTAQTKPMKSTYGTLSRAGGPCYGAMWGSWRFWTDVNGVSLSRSVVVRSTGDWQLSERLTCSLTKDADFAGFLN